MVKDPSPPFLEEAEKELTRIRSGILVHLQERAAVGELEVPLYKARTLGKNAAEAGFTEVAALSTVAADLLTVHIEANTALTDEDARSVLDLLARIEELLLYPNLDSDDFDLEISGLIDSSFENLRSSPGLHRPVPERQGWTPAAVESAEIDEDLLDVFAVEADELLLAIESNLAVLENDPGNREALWEIRRNAHTFKGAAGIVGQFDASGLAHRVEDLLDCLANKNAGVNEKVLSLLRSAMTCLRCETKGERASDLKDQIDSIYRGFDEIIREYSEKQTLNKTLAAEKEIQVNAGTSETSDSQSSKTQPRKVVRVSLDRLDEMMAIVRNLAAARDHLEEALRGGNAENRTRRLAEFASDSSEDVSELLNGQRRLIDELQTKLARIRMVEFATLSTRINRTVRVTCEEEYKRADVILQNEHLEIDTQILDTLVEPLLHLLRNAVVHGIETPEIRRLIGKPEKGRIDLNVLCDETHIELTVTDDGRGIALAPLKEKAIQHRRITREASHMMTESEALQLIFLPGLTTAEKLNMNAGRGVGMSIVKESVESRGGSISVVTEPQKGTKFTIRMPLSAELTDVLLAIVAGRTYALPQAMIVDSRSSDDQAGEAIHLAHLLGIDTVETEGFSILAGDPVSPRRIVVDSIIGRMQFAVKPFGKPLNRSTCYVGAGLLENGDPVPVLNLLHLIERSAISNTAAAETGSGWKPLSILLADDSPSIRHTTSRLLEDAGCRITAARDGLHAMEVLESGLRSPDLILTDVEMPKVDGYELLMFVKKNEKFRNIPVVMITSRSDDRHRQKAMELGASEFMTKPVDSSALISVIRRVSANAAGTQ